MLTEEQQKDLERAVAEYLIQRGHVKTAKCLQEESMVLADFDFKEGDKILQRKWSTILKLQSKILELEKKLAVAEEFISKSVRHMKPIESGDKPQDNKQDILTKPGLKLTKAYKGHKDSINSVSLHSTEPVFATGSDDSTLRIYDYELQDQLTVLKGHTHSVNSVSWTRHTLVSGSSDMSIKLWKSANKTNPFDFADFYCVKTLIGHEHSISTVFNVPDTDIVVSCSRDKSIKMWDRASGYCRKTVANIHSEWIRCCDSNKKHFLSSGNDMKVFVFDLDSLLNFDSKASEAKVLNVFDAHENFIESLKVYKEGEIYGRKTIAVTASRDKTIDVWDYMKGELIVEFKGHENWVRDLCIVEDSHLLVSVGEDKTIRIWDLAKKKQIYIMQNAHEHFILSLDYHAGYRVLATGSVDKQTKIWKIMNLLTQDVLESLSNGLN